MGNGNLQVDTEAVRSLADNLTLVHQQLSQADQSSQDVAAAVGHDGLGDSLRDFATKWDNRRQELIDQITQLRDGAEVIADEFDGLDSSLAQALLEAEGS